MTYKELFPAKAGRYFTGRCLALDEYPLARGGGPACCGGEFRERVIEMFQDAGADLDNFVQLCSEH